MKETLFQANLEEYKSDALNQNTVAALCTQKFSNVALYVIKK